ncbi:poly-gamma-glutamate hydrolase family protein [Halosolutus amylolyticus]|uniref:Poly-gamma-glutamate hydrolase family protein n=1 Tax=Halosolutus amylolyticus TaxID=2932267 RepID=A0ABD5PUL8_9EURY|nr:poly-gamma-glutamate hydrolase family protein [Halosolutus amylolyticus]
MPGSTFRTHTIERTETGELTELLYDDGANDEVLVCAAHGGRVEPGTAEQAVDLAARLPNASCWACLGYDEIRSEFDLWHPPSSAIAPDEYPLLGEIADRGFETVISLHGLGDDRVVVGGRIDEGSKGLVADRLARAVSHPVEAVDGGPYGGVSPNNFVNWLATGDRGGLQLEQSVRTRFEDADAVVAELVALVREGALYSSH